jgi:hypothetical protein
MWPLHNQSYCNISMKNGSNVIIERYVLFEGIEMIEYRFWHNYSYSICQQIAIYWYNISFTIKSIIHGYIRSFWLYANLIVYQVLEAGRILIFCEDFFSLFLTEYALAMFFRFWTYLMMPIKETRRTYLMMHITETRRTYLMMHITETHREH